MSAFLAWKATRNVLGERDEVDVSHLSTRYLSVSLLTGLLILGSRVYSFAGLDKVVRQGRSGVLFLHVGEMSYFTFALGCDVNYHLASRSRPTFKQACFSSFMSRSLLCPPI